MADASSKHRARTRFDKHASKEGARKFVNSSDTAGDAAGDTFVPLPIPVESTKSPSTGAPFGLEPGAWIPEPALVNVSSVIAMVEKERDQALAKVNSERDEALAKVEAERALRLQAEQALRLEVEEMRLQAEAQIQSLEAEAENKLLEAAAKVKSLEVELAHYKQDPEPMEYTQELEEPDECEKHYADRGTYFLKILDENATLLRKLHELRLEIPQRNTVKRDGILKVILETQLVQHKIAQKIDDELKARLRAKLETDPHPMD